VKWGGCGSVGCFRGDCRWGYQGPWSGNCAFVVALWVGGCGGGEMISSRLCVGKGSDRQYTSRRRVVGERV